MSDNNNNGYEGAGTGAGEKPRQYYFEGYYDTAYSMPADPDKHNSYQITSSSAPPAFPPQYEIRHVHQRHNPLRTFFLIVLGFVLIALSVIAVKLTAIYSIEVSHDEGDLNISISRRTQNNEIIPTARPGTTAEVAASMEPRDEIKQPPVYEYSASSITLKRPPASAGSTMSAQDIFKTYRNSVVSVYATDTLNARSGAGIILTEDGIIITNNHLTDNSSGIIVTIGDESGVETEYYAVLVGKDEATDIALLKIDAEGLIPAVFGDSQYSEVGDDVYAIGNPLNQTLTMTNGIISAINRKIKYNGFSMTLLQTNAAINEGNSGGPLINTFGQVIGITNMKMVSSEGMGFAIPMDVAKPVIDQLLLLGYVPGRPSLGVETQNMPIGYAVYHRIPRGVYVTNVWENSDASTKISSGDYILEISGEAVDSQEELYEKVNALQVGDTVILKLLRNRDYRYVEVTIMDASEFGY